MTQSHRLERLRQALYLALWIVPIPFGAFASDQPYFASFSLLVFLLASLSLPQTVRWRQRKRKGTSPYASAGSMLYGSVLVLLVAIGILNGFMPLDWWGNYFCRIAAYFAWMVLTVVVQAFVSWGVEAWQAGLRSHSYSDFVDPVLCSLPLPCAAMGMLLYPALKDNEYTQSAFIGILAVIGFGFLAITILTLLVFVVYFFPFKKRGYEGKGRVVQLVRIVIMGLLWLLVQGYFSNIQLGAFAAHFMPVAANNPVVFVAPFIFEGLVMMCVIAVGNVFVMLCEKLG